VKLTPVAFSPLAPIVTVYLRVSPGSALPSLSASVISESCLLAVTVGANGAAVGPTGLWEATDADAAVEVEVEVFTGSGLLLLAALGCDFHNHPALLDTETEKAATVTKAITAINSVADLLVLVKVEYLRYRRIRRINPGRFSSRGIGNSF
jgi:hypothetical protein